VVPPPSQSTIHTLHTHPLSQPPSLPPRVSLSPSPPSLPSIRWCSPRPFCSCASARSSSRWCLWVLPPATPRTQCSLPTQSLCRPQRFKGTTRLWRGCSRTRASAARGPVLRPQHGRVVCGGKRTRQGGRAAARGPARTGPRAVSPLKNKTFKMLFRSVPRNFAASVPWNVELAGWQAV